MKATTLANALATALVMGGLFCWSAAADDASGLWKMNCASCHGKDGKGQTMMGRRLAIKDLTDPKVQESFTDEKATKTIKEGITENGQQKMKAYGDKFSDQQMKDLVSFVRSLKAGK